MTTLTKDARGPYINESHDEVYYPASDWPFNAARHEASQYAEEVHGGFGRSAYDGKRDITLHDHDEPWDEWDDGCPREPCWSFTTYEGTWRR